MIRTVTTWPVVTLASLTFLLASCKGDSGAETGSGDQGADVSSTEAGLVTADMGAAEG